jgi:two-component system cell cycle sensor histidine kinase/response regulator CckA
MSQSLVHQAREQGEKLLLTLVNSLGGIVWEADPRTFQFSFVSAQAERILGFPARQWLDEPDFWRRHTHPDDVGWCSAFCLDATMKGRDHQFEYRMIAADGRVVWLQDIVTVQLVADGSVRLWGIMIDVTERKRTEEALRASEERYRSLVAASAQVVWTTDADGITADAPDWSALTGQSAEEVQGWGWLDAVHPDDRQRVRQATIEALKAKRSYVLEYRVRIRDGSYRMFAARAVPVLDDAGRVREWIGTCADITEHRTLQEQFQQSQKMEAIGQLAGGVAHDFNNLLTVINGYGEILLGTLPKDSPARTFVEEMRRAGERAASLTRQLLTFSRRQMLTPQVLDLNAIVRDTEKMLRRLIGADVDLNTSLDPGLWAIKADQGQIEQVLMNLAVNARDAMPQGGKLTIETRNVNLDKGFAQMHLEGPAGPHVLLAVSDNGEGMTEEVKRHLFEPFFTTKPPGKGTGLGLAAVYGIVKHAGGVIDVYSELGHGTSFKVYLPVTAERAASGRSLAGLSPRPRGDETILVVEDEEAVRSLSRHILEGSGYRVLEARNGREALHVAEKLTGRLHLLLTDVVMPEMGGAELARRLSAFRPGLKVLYLSGYADDAVIRHGALDREVSYLQKPFTTESLIRRVREVLDAP